MDRQEDSVETLHCIHMYINGSDNTCITSSNRSFQIFLPVAREPDLQTGFCTFKRLLHCLHFEHLRKCTKLDWQLRTWKRKSSLEIICKFKLLFLCFKQFINHFWCICVALVTDVCISICSHNYLLHEILLSPVLLHWMHCTVFLLCLEHIWYKKTYINIKQAY